MGSSYINFFITLSATAFIISIEAATFEISNKCPYTVSAAAVPGGGRRLDRGQSWTLNVRPGTKQARIWAQTKCNFNPAGRGRCENGGCNGLIQCQNYGQPPNTLAEYALNQYNNLDFFDISLVDGFNVLMDFSPVSGNCRGIRCTANINRQCPNALRASGGCNKRALFLRQISTVVTLVDVTLQSTPSFSSRGASMLIVTPRMILPAPLPVPMEQTMGWYFALRAVSCVLNHK